MNTAHFVKVKPKPTAQDNFSAHSKALGLPPNSQHGLVLGKLFKLHPNFDEVLFSILLQSQRQPWYILFISERNSDLNRLLYQRWRDKQREICCGKNKWTRQGIENPLQTLPCCHYFSFCERKLSSIGSSSVGTREAEQEQEWREEEEFITQQCQNFVLHRLRFVHYARYLDALFSASAVLDTFPYGGACFPFSHSNSPDLSCLFPLASDRMPHLTRCDVKWDPNGYTPSRTREVWYFLSRPLPSVLFSCPPFPCLHCPLTFCLFRGRYSLGMYLQMNHTDLIASSPTEYTSLVLRLFSDSSFQKSQAQQIEEKFREKIHQNHEVIREWLEFLCRLTRPQDDAAAGRVAPLFREEVKG
jgi:hypothetical protein